MATSELIVADVVATLGVEAPPAWAPQIPGRRLDGAAPIRRAGPSDVTFLTAAAAARDLGARAGLLLADAAVDPPSDVAVPSVANPRVAFIRVVAEHFAPQAPRAAIDPSAVFAPDAVVDATASVGPHCTVGARSVVGPGCTLHPGVVLYAGMRLGRRVTIHLGTVVGAPGVGYERDDRGVLVHFPHLGGVVLGDDVDVGANTCVDRGTLDDTVVGPRTRIDNPCHIAHSVRLGENWEAIACAEVSGSCIVEDRAWLDPNATLHEGLRIGCGAMVGLGSVVLRDVDDGAVDYAVPARARA